MRREELEVARGRRQHHEFTTCASLERTLGSHPQTVDRLSIVVQGFLSFGHLREKETGVEPSRFANRGDPVAHVVHRVRDQP